VSPHALGALGLRAQHALDLFGLRRLRIATTAATIRFAAAARLLLRLSHVNVHLINNDCHRSLL
jgi:hypothetical protein